MRRALLVVALLLASSWPAAAQMDSSGEWVTPRTLVRGGSNLTQRFEDGPACTLADASVTVKTLF